MRDQTNVAVAEYQLAQAAAKRERDAKKLKSLTCSYANEIY